MTDKKNDYYQPWARDSSEQGDAQNGIDQGPGLAKPQDAPPVGMDLSRYAEEERLPRAPLIDGDKLKENGARLAHKLRSTAASFAAWTIAAGEKADIPARLEALEIPRRSRILAQRSGTAAAAATRAAAQRTAKASKASARKGREIWRKMALGDRVSKLGSEAGRGLSDMTDKTKSGLAQLTKAGKDSLEETAEKLRPAPRDPKISMPPPSGLEQLLAREDDSTNSAAAIPASSDLPLFSADPKNVSAEPGSMAPLADSANAAHDTACGEPAAHDTASGEPAAHDTASGEPAALAAKAHAPAMSGAAPAAAVPPPLPPVAAQPAASILSEQHVRSEQRAIAHQRMSADPSAVAPASKSAPAPLPEHEPPAVPAYQPVKHAPRAVPHAEAAPVAAPIADLWRPSGRTMALAGITLALLLGTSFWLGSRFGGGLTRADVETIVGDYITANPQVIPAALEAQRNSEIAKAIDAVRPALEKPYAGAWGGNADGDVTLVVFTDYACGFCRASLPDIDRLVREDKRLKVVYRELPIISRESRNAALMALAAARQGKYDAFHHAMFAQSSLSPGAIIAAAEQAGVSLDGSGDATADEAVFQRELESNLALATQLQLNATPTWVIGDQLLQGQVGYQALQDAVTKARAGKSI